MAHGHETIDISNNPDLLRLAEEVRRRNTAAVLTNGAEDVAVVMPLADVTKRARTRVKSDADYRAFLDSAGSWADVDVEEFKRYIRERRDASSRSPVEL